MNKAILLLHGFKRNDVDDYAELHDYLEVVKERIGASKIYNEVWFENYEKDTLNLKYLDKRIEEIIETIKKDNIDELIIIAYSAGTIVGAMVKERIGLDKVTYLGVAPTFNIHLLKWISTLGKMRKSEKALKAKLGKERYARIKKTTQENKTAEKYPVKIMYYMFSKVIGKRRKYLSNTKGSKFLIAKDDHIVKAKKSIKKLSKHNEITVEDYTHDLALKSDKQFFKDWVDSVLK